MNYHLITSINEIKESISKIKQHTNTSVSNLFISDDKLNLFISNQLLYSFQTDKSVFFYLKLHNYFKLYFISHSYEDLYKDLLHLPMPETVITCEILGRDNLENEQKILQQCGFKERGKQIHITKNIKQNTYKDYKFPDCISFASMENYEEIKKFIYSIFDNYLDLSITDAELKYYIQNQTVLKLMVNGKLAGIAVYDIKGIRIYGILLGVLPEYKGTVYSMILCAVSANLLDIYKTPKLFMGYVREDNPLILDYYKRMKFKEDGLKSIIFYKENGDIIVDELKLLN